MSNPDEEITFTGTLSLEDAVHLERYYLLYLFPGWLRPVSLGLCAVLILGLILLHIHDAQNATSAWIFFVGWAFLAFSLLVHWLLWYLPRRTAARYRAHPESHVEHRVTLNSDSLRLASVNLYVRFPWRDLAKVIDTPDGLLFLLAWHQPLMWLPSRLFEGNGYKQAILGFAKNASVAVDALC